HNIIVVSILPQTYIKFTKNALTKAGHSILCATTRLELRSKLFTSFKASHFFSFDFDNCTGLWVASVTCSSFRYRESTKTYQSYFISFFQGFSNSINE